MWVVYLALAVFFAAVTAVLHYALGWAWYWAAPVAAFTTFCAFVGFFAWLLYGMVE